MRSSSSLAILALATTALGLSGEASFYGGNLSGGTCSFSSYTLPAGIYGTALSGANWDSAAHCGACVEVTGPSGTKITAMVYCLPLSSSGTSTNIPFRLLINALIVAQTNLISSQTLLPNSQILQRESLTPPGLMLSALSPRH